MKVTEKVRALLFEGKQKKKKKYFSLPTFSHVNVKRSARVWRKKKQTKTGKSQKKIKREKMIRLLLLFFFNVCDFSGL